MCIFARYLTCKLPILIFKFNIIRNLHSIGVLHLDIKPDNIIIDSNDFSHADSSLISLVYFGISKFYRDSKG